MTIHLIDGTYELFRQFYGRRRFLGDDAPELFAVGAVCSSFARAPIVLACRRRLFASLR